MNNFLFYSGEDGTTKIHVLFGDEDIWLTQKFMAEVFDVSVPTINEHFKNIFQSNELEQISVIRKFPITASDGDIKITSQLPNEKKH